MRLPRGTDAAGLWFLVALALTGAGNLGFHVVVSRMLGPAAYGALGSLWTLLVLATVPASGCQNIVTALVARLDRARQPDGSVLYGRSITVGAACMVLVMLASPM